MRVSFIIPNFNGEDILRKNLPRVIASAQKYARDPSHAIEIILVDDCSTDSSIAIIEGIFAENKQRLFTYKLIKNPVNKGFASTVNNGAKHASGEILILLNTDVYPDENEDFFSSALAYFKDPNYFAVGFLDKSVEEDGRIVLRGRGVGHWRRGLLVHKKGNINRQSTLWVSGGSSAYSRGLWEKLGGMNEIYNPFYWEDIDLSYRALKSGYKIVFEQKCVVVHEHERGAIKQSRSRFAIQTIAHRNQLMFVWLNLTDIRLLFSHVLWLPYHLINTLAKGDSAFLLGFVKALSKLPQITQKRTEYKKLFVRTDQEIVEEFKDEKIS